MNNNTAQTAQTKQSGLNDLLCCPFCGKEGNLLNLKNRPYSKLTFDVFAVGCKTESCFACLPSMNASDADVTARMHGVLTPERAVTVWNQRAT